MDMARASIIEEIISNIFWLDVILAITYIKNIKPITTFNTLSSYQKLENILLDHINLQVLEF